MEVMALPLRLFLSAHSLFSSRAQTLIVVSIRDDNFQLDLYESSGTELKWGWSFQRVLQTFRKADFLCDAAGVK